MTSFLRKKVLVAGLDASGVAACQLLRERGASVTGVVLEAAGLDQTNLKEMPAGVAVVAQGECSLEGFDLAVTSAQVGRDHPLVQSLVAAGVRVWSDLEMAFQRIACLTIAVSGTNGKTTAGEMIEQILKGCGRKVSRAGGSGRPPCAVAEETRELDFLILEVNSFQLEGIESFRPAVAVLLNLKPDHMDRYDRMPAYVATMSRVFQNQQVFDWAVVQSEALAHIRSMKLQIPSKVITFSGQTRRSDIYPDRSLLVSALDGWSGPLMDMDETALKGPHNAENAMAALAVGHVLRLSLEEMVASLRDYQPGPHRLELVARLGGVEFINNSKALNVDALEKSILSVPPVAGGRPNVWLIAGGKDKGLDYHDLGPLLASRVRGAFLIGETREKLRAAWSLFTPCTVVDSLLEAVDGAYEQAESGDLVLLSPACSSYDMFQNYQHRGEVFREAVKALIAKNPGLDAAGRAENPDKS